MACSISADDAEQHLPDDAEQHLPDDAEQHLPDEMLETLFYHFSGTTIGRAQAVCRRWNSIVIGLTHSTDIWFRCCKEEIPKYTLMQMCNHPVERQYRSRADWKDVYVRWRNYRGRKLLGRAELDPKMVVSITDHTWGRRQYRPCFTDDVAFFHDGFTNIAAFDLHSEASVKKKINSNQLNGTPYKLLTLGITNDLNAEGNNTFETNVKKSVLLFLFEDQFEILIGLEPKVAVQLPQLTEIGAVSTWFDTIVVETRSADGCKLQVYQVHLPTDGENEEVSVDHTQSFCINTPGRAVIDLTHCMLLTGNKALMLLEWTQLMIFDIDKGEECGSLFLNKRGQFNHSSLMSWVGSTVAVTEFKHRDDINHDIYMRQSDIILYFLDEECERLLSIARLDPHDIINAFSLLYDDSIIMINSNKCNVLLFTRGDQDADNWSRDEILNGSSVAVQETKGHSEQMEQEGDCREESLVSKSTGETCDSDTVDEANSYKATLSSLLGINLGDPLWKNFDEDMKHASGLSYKDNDGESNSSDPGDEENDKDGSCSSYEVYIEDRWNGQCTDQTSSELVRSAVIHRLSFPHQGYEMGHWKYYFTSSSVAMEPVPSKPEERLYLYKWNYMQ